VRLPPELATAERRIEGDYGQITFGEFLFARPGGHGVHHGAKMVGACFGIPVDRPMLDALSGIQVRLKPRWAATGGVDLATV
jgi:hypothetical protein